MVYRVTGVFRRRIDELLPFFQSAQLLDDPSETLLRLIDPNPLHGSAEVRAQPPGFYIHWWTQHPALIDAPEARNVVFTNIGRWTQDLYQKERYADFSRKTGDLTVGHYGLFPYAADPALSARVISDGLTEIVRHRQHVEALVQNGLAKAAAGT